MGSAASFGQWVRRRRKALDITQEELADRVGCARSTIRMIEGGERRPSRQLIALLADRLGIAEEEREAFLRLAREPQANEQAPQTESAPPAEEGEVAYTPTNLRQEPTRIIGRDGEVEEIRGRLLQRGMRLLTLTGPPGVGKTRLALAVAEDLLNGPGAVDMPAPTQRFADGVFFIGLATVSDTELVAPTMAQALELREATQPPLELLKKHLRTRRVLLVLDNFEQVLEAAPLLSELLLECPGVACLVTSREPLRVRGEQQFEVSSLPWPGKGELHSVEEMLTYPAVALFVERARSVDRSFHLSEDNAAAVATLCARVDGLPLAIELVAARVKLLPPAALVQRFKANEGHTSLPIVSGGGRDLPERHRTLRNAIGWSYELLNQGERVLFSRLGVFAGGCTLNSVESVCNARADLSISVLEGLQSLLDKSLLKREIQIEVGSSEETEPRYTMLEMVREYAGERLEEGDETNGGEADKVKGWFLDYYLALTVAAEPHLLGADQKRWLDLLEAEHDNLRAALAWAFERDQVELGLRMACALRHFWYIRGHFEEGLRWLQAALLKVEGCPVPRPLLITALNAAGWLAMGRSHFEKASGWLTRSLALAREEGDRKSLADTLHHLAVMRVYTGKHIEARQLHEEALSLRRELGDRSGMARTLGNLAGVAMHLGELEEAYRLFQETVSLLKELEHKWNQALMLSNLAHVTLRQGDYSQSAAFCEESLKLDEAIGEGIIFAHTTNCQGDIARRQGDFESALRLYRVSLEASDKIDFHFVIALNLLGLGCLSAQVGQPERAATFFGALEGLIEQGNSAILLPVDKPEHERHLATVRAALDEATFNRAWAEGRVMNVDQIVEYAQA
ncbi:MAG TPA: tetratricopeptide repeat protein [Chloroflexia bacterium]|jgi:predicted ATPase/DNA-binding XRE family transcriptional regulator